jgi:AAA domain, putative AbiEii toxin, Type IV TA system/AAA ATPase domain
MPEHSLDNVTIDGFRGLRHLRLDGLGRINILVGENNSGKTSVLEALSILCNAFEPYEWVSMVRRRDFGRLDETRIQSLRWCFPQTGQLADPEHVFEGECTMSCDGTVPFKTLRVTYRDIVGDPDPRETERRRRGLVAEGKEGEDEEVGDTEPRRGAEITHFVGTLIPNVAQIWEDAALHVGLPRSFRTPVATETLTPYSYQINRVQVRYHSRYLFGTDRDIVLDLIREFDPEITDLKQASFRGMRPALYLNHKRLGPAPLSIFGDALRRAVLLAGTLLSLKGGGILMIDEIETGIHVKALQRVFRWLTDVARRLNVQVVATTHSLEAVDAMALSAGDSLGDVVTFHLDQTEQETRVKRIDGELLLRLRRERGLDVR